LVANKKKCSQIKKTGNLLGKKPSDFSEKRLAACRKMQELVKRHTAEM